MTQWSAAELRLYVSGQIFRLSSAANEKNNFSTNFSDLKFWKRVFWVNITFSVNSGTAESGGKNGKDWFLRKGSDVGMALASR